MKVAVVGDFFFPIYQESLCSQLECLGEQVRRIEVPADIPYSKFSWNRISRRFLPGPFARKMQRLFFDRLEAQPLDPDTRAIIFYRCRWVSPDFLTSVRRKVPNGTRLIELNVDNPFGSGYRPDFWETYRRTLPHYDVVFTKDTRWVDNYLNVGCTDVRVLPLYVPDEDVSIGKRLRDREVDVVFVGHFEDDGREDCLEKLLSSGISVEIYGTGWHGRLSGVRRSPIVRLDYNSYLAKLSNSKLGLCFFSKLNEDQYTRRVLEIPGRGAVLVSERSRTVEGFFGDGALYFSSPDECLRVVRDALDAVEDSEWRQAAAFEKVFSEFRGSIVVQGLARAFE